MGHYVKASEICAIAGGLVDGDRERTHGKKVDSFSYIAELWTAYLGVKVDPEEVPILLILQKIGRIKYGELNLDDFVDIAGYAACAGEVAFDINKGEKEE
jgi:hypothetical protein